MDKTNEQIEIVTAVGGALLELQGLVESCCQQTIPEGLWEEDDDHELHINEPVARQFLNSFDHDELFRKLSKARELLAESETKLFAYRRVCLL